MTQLDLLQLQPPARWQDRYYQRSSDPLQLGAGRAVRLCFACQPLKCKHHLFLWVLGQKKLLLHNIFRQNVYVLFWSTWRLRYGRTARRTEKVSCRNIMMVFILPQLMSLRYVWKAEGPVSYWGRAGESNVLWHPTTTAQQQWAVALVFPLWISIHNPVLSLCLTKWARRGEKYEDTVTF